MNNSDYDWLSVNLRNVLLSKFEGIEQVTALRCDYPKIVTTEFYDLLEGIIRENNDNDSKCDVELNRAELQSTLEKFNKQILPKLKRKTKEQKQEPAPFIFPFKGSIWTTRSEKKSNHNEPKIYEKTPMVLLLENTNESKVLNIAPISIHTDFGANYDLILPATDKHTTMMVCVWNKQRIRSNQLFRYVGELDNVELQYLELMLKSFNTQLPPQSIPNPYIGKKISDMEDERNIFQEAEKLGSLPFFECSIPKDINDCTSKPSVIVDFYENNTQEFKWQFTASNFSSQIHENTYSVDSLNIEVIFSLESESDVNVIVNIFDSLGNISHKLDGAKLNNSHKNLTTFIENSNALIPKAFLEFPLSIITHNGKYLTLKPLAKPSKNNLRKLISILRSSPTNTSLMLDKELCELLDNKASLAISENSTANILSEILCRHWLYYGNISKLLSEQLNKYFSIEQQSNFRNALISYRQFPLSGCNCLRSYSNNPVTLWQNKTTLMEIIEKRVKNRIIKYINADGIIPIVRENVALPLFFTLEKKSNEDDLYILDKQNRKIDAWGCSIEKLNKNRISNWSITLDISRDDQLLDFQGHSLELPVLLAIFKKEGTIPFYSHFAMLASGRFSNLKLKRVGHIIQKNYLAQKMRIKYFLIPQDDSPLDLPYVLDEDISIHEIQKVVTKLLIDNNICELSLDETINVFDALEHDIRFGILPLREKAIPRLDQYQKVFESNNDTKNILRAKLLRAVVYCHLGRTIESKRLNQECQKIATSTDDYYIYGRALVEQMVNLTDLGELDLAFSQAKHFENILANTTVLKEGQKNDLLMRYYGTLGQLQAYITLAKGTGQADLSKDSLESFKKAVELANQSIEKSDLAHDLNYIHLWHALFNSGTDAEINAFQNAYKVASSLPENEMQKNHSYLYRQYWFGLYRRCLSGETIKDNKEWRKPVPRIAESWLNAMTRKYIGTLKASEGNLKVAKGHFELALSRLNGFDMPLLNLIGMTTAVQAWDSLKYTEFNDFAQKCYQKALDFFSSQEILSTYKFASEWKDYLEQKGEGITNPQLKFQY